MKILLIIASFSLGMDISEIRDLFTRASENESDCIRLVELTDGYNIDYKPVVYAYHAAAEMTMANHVVWPGSKFSYFKHGRIKLEMVVEKNKENVEIRFIRYAVQKGSPSFLDYNANLKEDKLFIERNLDGADLPSDLKRTIVTMIKS